tara:strand:- start:2529 stop:3191 length:663 start_codon:yes stop_codon:yes gene_type:complete
MNCTYFDIETGPLPDSELLAMIPAFDPSEVKLGNIKDPDKIAAKLKEREESHFDDAREKAALSPLTGHVIAIGCGLSLNNGVNETAIMCESEPEALAEFWELFEKLDTPFIGFNINTFDLPFMVKRSWKLGVSVPISIRSGRYFSNRFIDLRDMWQMGDRQAKGSLDAICRHFGVEGKNGHGKDFARLFELDRETALDYLANDLRMTRAVHERMTGIGAA